VRQAGCVLCLDACPSLRVLNRRRRGGPAKRSTPPPPSTKLLHRPLVTAASDELHRPRKPEPDSFAPLPERWSELWRGSGLFAAPTRCSTTGSIVWPDSLARFYRGARPAASQARTCTGRRCDASPPSSTLPCPDPKPSPMAAPSSSRRRPGRPDFTPARGRVALIFDYREGISSLEGNPSLQTELSPAQQPAGLRLRDRAARAPRPTPRLQRDGQSRDHHGHLTNHRVGYAAGRHRKALHGVARSPPMARLNRRAAPCGPDLGSVGRRRRHPHRSGAVLTEKSLDKGPPSPKTRATAPLHGFRGVRDCWSNSGACAYDAYQHANPPWRCIY
jgi:hypothetical protein